MRQIGRYQRTLCFSWNFLQINSTATDTDL